MLDGICVQHDTVWWSTDSNSITFNNSDSQPKGLICPFFNSLNLIFNISYKENKIVGKLSSEIFRY